MNSIIQCVPLDEHATPIRVEDYDGHKVKQYQPTDVTYATGETLSISAQAGVAAILEAEKSRNMQYTTTENVTFQGIKTDANSTEVQWTWMAPSVSPLGLDGDLEFWVKISTKANKGVKAFFCVDCTMEPIPGTLKLIPLWRNLYPIG